MNKRVCVFVDGENFRFSIVELFEQFDRTNYLPKKANWSDLFDSFVRKVAPDSERVRTYWYVVQYLDLFPYKYPDIETKPEALQRLLNKDKQLEKTLEKLKGNELKDAMTEIVKTLRQRKNQMSRRFDGWRNLQDNIASRYSRIEFRRAGAITFNAFTQQLQKEKAVDVKLATDLIVLRDIYDIAVIVSGDQDYVPAVKVVKDFGKIVINVAFLARNGRLLPGGARRLNHLTDDSIEIGYAELAKYLKIPTHAAATQLTRCAKNCRK